MFESGECVSVHASVRAFFVYEPPMQNLPCFVRIVRPDAAVMKRKNVVEVMGESRDFVWFRIRIAAPCVRPTGFPASWHVLRVHQLTIRVVATLIA